MPRKRGTGDRKQWRPTFDFAAQRRARQGVIIGPRRQSGPRAELPADEQMRRRGGKTIFATLPAERGTSSLPNTATQEVTQLSVRRAVPGPAACRGYRQTGESRRCGGRTDLTAGQLPKAGGPRQSPACCPPPAAEAQPNAAWQAAQCNISQHWPLSADLDTNIGAVCSPYLAAAGPGSDMQVQTHALT